MAQTVVEEDRGTGVDTRLERARAELSAPPVPTRSDGAPAARLAKDAGPDAPADDGAGRAGRRRRALQAMGAPDDRRRCPHPDGARRRGVPGLASPAGPDQAAHRRLGPAPRRAGRPAPPLTPPPTWCTISPCGRCWRLSGFSGLSRPCPPARPPASSPAATTATVACWTVPYRRMAAASARLRRRGPAARRSSASCPLLLHRFRRCGAEPAQGLTAQPPRRQLPSAAPPVDVDGGITGTFTLDRRCGLAALLPVLYLAPAGEGLQRMPIRAGLHRSRRRRSSSWSSSPRRPASLRRRRPPSPR